MAGREKRFGYLYSSTGRLGQPDISAYGDYLEFRCTKWMSSLADYRVTLDVANAMITELSDSVAELKVEIATPSHIVLITVLIHST